MSEPMIEIQKEKMGFPPLHTSSVSSLIQQPPTSTNPPVVKMDLDDGVSGNHVPNHSLENILLNPVEDSSVDTSSIGVIIHNNNNNISNGTDNIVPAARLPIDTVPGAAPSSAPTLREAAASLWSEDERLQRFLHLLAMASSSSRNNNNHQQQQHTDEHSMYVTMESTTTSPSSNALTQKHNIVNPFHAENRGPTVPVSLSRRMLQKQGVGYLDTMVASLTSASADRFLATVLHQAIICRNQRIQGQEFIQSHWKKYWKFMQRRNQERARKRRKIQRIDQFLQQFVVPNALVTNTSGSLPTTKSIHANMNMSTNAIQRMQTPENPNTESTSPNMTTTPSPSKTSAKKRSKTSPTHTNKAPTSNLLTVNIPMNQESLLKILDDAEQVLFEAGDNMNTENKNFDSIEEASDYYQKYCGDLYAPPTNDKQKHELFRDGTIDVLDDGQDNPSDEEDDDDVNDSQDEEAEDDEEDEDDAIDNAIHLRDLARPLEAWGINLLGKIGMGVPSSSRNFNSPFANGARKADTVDNDNGLEAKNEDANNKQIDKEEDFEDDMYTTSIERQADYDSVHVNEESELVPVQSKKAAKPKVKPKGSTGSKSGEKKKTGVNESKVTEKKSKKMHPKKANVTNADERKETSTSPPNQS